MASETEAREFIGYSEEELKNYLISAYEPEKWTKYEGNTGGEAPSGPQALAIAIDAIKNKARASPDFFRRTICTDLKYCERRNSQEVMLIVAIADTALITSFQLLFPPAALAAYVLRVQILDKFCGCRAESSRS